MTALPGISIVVVVLNGAAYARGCALSLLAQDYAGPHEVIFVDGGSADGTTDILASIEGIKTISCLEGIAASRNRGIAGATFPFVAFTDVDCLVPATWLRDFMTCFQLHQTPSLAGVGGSNTAVHDGRLWTSALNLMKHTFLGSNGSIYGTAFAADRPVDHIATINCLYDAALLRAQPFLISLHPTGEDAELSWRLYRSGYTFMYCAGATILHHLRSTPWLWAKRMFAYGAGRWQVLMLHPDQFFYKAALLGPLLLMPLAVASLWSQPVRWLLCAYVLVLLLESLLVSLRARRPVLILPVLTAFLVTHIAYGLGMWSRLLGLYRR